MDNPSIKVLVIDDEAGIADFMKSILELKGYTAFMETDGLRAVELFKKERPDIVLIDVDLGYSEIYGVEVLKRIKAIDKDAVCLMVTRITDEESVKQSKEFGALHYLLKPLDGKGVVKVVNDTSEIIYQRRASGG